MYSPEYTARSCEEQVLCPFWNLSEKKFPGVWCNDFFFPPATGRSLQAGHLPREPGAWTRYHPMDGRWRQTGMAETASSSKLNTTLMNGANFAFWDISVSTLDSVELAFLNCGLLGTWRPWLNQLIAWAFHIWWHEFALFLGSCHFRLTIPRVAGPPGPEQKCMLLNLRPVVFIVWDEWIKFDMEECHLESLLETVKTEMFLVLL